MYTEPIRRPKKSKKSEGRIGLCPFNLLTDRRAVDASGTLDTTSNKLSLQFQWLLVFGRGRLSWNILGIVTICLRAARNKP
jgi:hypothetical protein